MQYKADIVVRSSNGSILAVVEIKNRQEMDAEIASWFRRNMIAHGLLTEIPYFLLLSQEYGYLWYDSRDSNALPTIEFSMVGVVSRYFPSRDTTRRLSGEQLELLTIQWLTDLSTAMRTDSEYPESTLAATGFLASMRGASILVEAPV